MMVKPPQMPESILETKLFLCSKNTDVLLFEPQKFPFFDY